MILEGKVAIVTGGAQGVGKAVSAALLEKKCKVAVLDVAEDKGRETTVELGQKHGNENVIFIKCDVVQEDNFEDAFKKTIAHFGALDIVINNAGCLTPENWKKMLQVNLTGVTLGVLLGRKYMGVDSKGKGGAVVNVASSIAYKSFPPSPIYCATNYGILGLSRAYGDEEIHYKRSQVSVNAICPDNVDTEQYRNFLQYLGTVRDSQRFLDQSKEGLQPSYVAEGVIRVLEDGKTGQALSITRENGFQYLNLPAFQEVSVKGLGENTLAAFAELDK